MNSLAKDSQLCSQARAIINRVVNYFAQLKMRSGGRGPLKEPWKPLVSDCDGFKTDFPKARFFSKPQNTRWMSSRYGSIYS